MIVLASISGWFLDRTDDPSPTEWLSVSVWLSPANESKRKIEQYKLNDQTLCVKSREPSSYVLCRRKYISRNLEECVCADKYVI